MKMRINNKKNSCCDECGCQFKHTEEMYDFMICGTVYTVCKQCSDKMFRLLLKASCGYNAKVKSADDMARIQKAKDWRLSNGGS